jgi:PAS domain S-box-containing protein
MKKQDADTLKTISLRQRAEEILDRKLPETPSALSETDMQHLIHELQVHQVELELQNHELIQAKELAETTSEKYTELYDFAPSSYFTLTKEAEIVALNLCGAEMLGGERSKLLHSHFGYFISRKIRPQFDHFLNDVFSSSSKKFCELTLTHKDASIKHVYLSGVRIGNEDQCFLTALDITGIKIAEENLKLTNARLRSFINSDLIGIIIATDNGNIIEANDHYLNLIGFTRAEFETGKVNWRAITPAEWLPSDEKALAELRENGKCTPYEKEYLRPDGTRVAVLITDAIIQGEGEQILGFILDITHRRQTEQALQEINELLSLFMKHSPIHSFIKKVSPGESLVLKASENYIDMIGVTGSDMAGKTMFELFPHEFAVKITDDDWAVVSTGNAITLEEDLNGRNYTTIKFPIYRDKDKLLAGYTIDITERKQAEKALVESRELYRDLIELAVDGVLVGSHEGVIIDANSCICAMSGKTKEDLIGRNINDSIFSPESMKLVPMQFGRLINGEVVVNERNILRPDGSEIAVEMRSKMMPNGTYQSIIRDITERKQAEELLRKKNAELFKLNVEKDKLFSIISHDLRSPFNIFLGYTQMMVESLPKLDMDEIQVMAESMKSSANNLYSLLENLLEWSRMQRGIIKFEPKPFLLMENVENCLRSNVDSANAKGIYIHLNFDDELEVFADFKMLESTIRNLVSNAIKFTPKGGKITIRANPIGGNRVEISVSDNGIGMNKNMMNKLFRIDENINRKGTNGEPSTGLGLLLCKDFIDLQGGTIWAESDEGKGSKFSFTLPEKEEMG